MREKKLWLILTFPTTTAAMAMEDSCMKEGMPGRLIPVPREITAGCGMAWSAPAEARPALEAFVQSRNITTAGWYELLL